MHMGWLLRPVGCLSAGHVGQERRGFSGGNGDCDQGDKVTSSGDRVGAPLTFGEKMMEKNPQGALQTPPELREAEERET